MDAANDSFTDAQVTSHITNRHQLPQVHHHPGKALCVIALWHNTRRHGIRHAIANSTFQQRYVDEQNSAIRPIPSECTM